MKQFLRLSFVFALIMMGAGIALGQSATTRLGTYDVGGATEYSQYLYIGAGAHITIPTGQTWVIASRYVQIDPTAVIDGGGQIIFDDPGNFGPASETVAWAGQPITVSGGNSQILANVVNRNPNNIVLGPVTVTADAALDGITANTNHTLYIGTSFGYALTHADATSITGNDVILGNNDFRFATAATQTGYSPTSFAVTNGTGHVVKDSYTGAWTFPVGIAEGDYTPAKITNTTANGMRVLVQDYATSASVEKGSNGIDRTWNIYADNAAGNATVDLQHNTATNQASFSNASHFVTRYGPSAPNGTGDNTLSLDSWQSNTLIAGTSPGTLSATGTVAGAVETSHAFTSFATTAADPISFYSKSSNPAYPLPVKLISFNGTERNCAADLAWVTGSEKSFDHFEVMYSNDGSSYRTVGSIAGKGNASGSNYSFTYPQENGKGYYRLRMVDANGAATYSNTVTLTINCGPDAGISVSPNPTSGLVTIKGLQAGNTVRVYGINGQLVISTIAASAISNIDISAFANGAYTVIILDGNKRLKTAKVLKRD